MGGGGLSRGMQVILWRQGIIVIADIKDEANFTSNQKYGRGNQKVVADLRAVREGVREITRVMARTAPTPWIRQALPNPMEASPPKNIIF